MYRAVFGVIKKGHTPDEAELQALYALMEPTLRKLKMKRVSPKERDARLIDAFPAFYEYYAIHKEHPDSYWDALDGSFPEKKAEKNMRKEFRRIWKELFPPKQRTA